MKKFLSLLGSLTLLASSSSTVAFTNSNKNNIENHIISEVKSPNLNEVELQFSSELELLIKEKIADFNQQELSGSKISNFTDWTYNVGVGSITLRWNWYWFSYWEIILSPSLVKYLGDISGAGASFFSKVYEIAGQSGDAWIQAASWALAMFLVGFEFMFKIANNRALIISMFGYAPTWISYW